jgi:hypothetical protein
MIPMTFYDALGLVGATLFVIAFAGVQAEKLDAHGWTNLVMNFVGAILVLISLRFAFNLASFALESVWGLIAFYGLVRKGLRRKA